MLAKKIRFLSVAAMLCLFTLIAPAQTTSVFTTGLTRPVKIITAGDNSLLVTEGGTMVPNSGRLSRIDRTTGARQTLINGLPSGVNNLGGPPSPSGVTGLILHGHTLYVAINGGDSVQNVGGVEFPNPNPPASPIFASVLELDLPGDWEQLSSSFVMTLANQAALAAGDLVTLTNADGESLTIRLVVNLPDYTPNPRPGFPTAVRFSNPFGIEIFQKHVYVVDASQNDIKKIDIESGTTSVFVVFPNRPNPLFPTIGGPFIEPVPDSIRRVGNRFMVPLLTGFPFVQGLAEVRAIEIKGGANVGLIPNLTSAIDILQVEDEASASAAGDESSYYTLEFSTNQLANAPGRLRFYSTPTATPVNVVSLITPTSMARNETTGDIFVTNIFPGTITKISFPPILFFPNEK